MEKKKQEAEYWKIKALHDVIVNLQGDQIPHSLHYHLNALREYAESRINKCVYDDSVVCTITKFSLTCEKCFNNKCLPSENEELEDIKPNICPKCGCEFDQKYDECICGYCWK